MTPRIGAAGTGLLLGFLALSLAACNATAPPAPAPPAQTGGASGAPGTGGSPRTGGSPAQPPAGSGGSPVTPPATGGTTGPSPGTGGSPPQPSPDAPPAEVSPPAPSDDKPLPPCGKTTMVSSSAELASAITAAQPGECIVLADGSYSFPTITKVATEAAPIVIRAANRGKAVVASGPIHLLKSAYVVLEGFDITSSGGAAGTYFGGSNGVIVGFDDSHHCRLSRSRLHPMGAVGDRDWIVIVGADAHHNRIDHNELGPVTAVANMLVIDGTGREEPQMDGQVAQHNRIDHNYFHDVNNTGGNNWESMRIGRSWQAPSKGFNIIEYNLLERATGDPETISLKSSDNTVRYNTIRSTNGEICSRHGNRNQIYGNYILGGSRGMRIYGADHRIYNNYVASSSIGIWLDAGAASATEEAGKEHYAVYRTWVYNNTLINRSIQIGGNKTYAPRDCRIANNIIVGAGVTGGGPGLVNEGNLTGANPLTMQDGIFRLTPEGNGAMAIGKAVNADFYKVTDDIQGQPRDGVDVGADEHSTAPVTVRGPLTTADVGPNAP